jgi:hypothetical protein
VAVTIFVRRDRKNSAARRPAGFEGRLRTCDCFRMGKVNDLGGIRRPVTDDQHGRGESTPREHKAAKSIPEPVASATSCYIFFSRSSICPVPGRGPTFCQCRTQVTSNSQSDESIATRNNEQPKCRPRIVVTVPRDRYISIPMRVTVIRMLVREFRPRQQPDCVIHQFPAPGPPPRRRVEVAAVGYV